MRRCEAGGKIFAAPTQALDDALTIGHIEIVSLTGHPLMAHRA